jgi:hypothetical protein
MQKTGTCGTATIQYDDNCDWTCLCPSRKPCTWFVQCPDGKGGYNTTSGTGLVKNGGGGHGGKGHFSIDASAIGLAKILEKISGQRIEVPKEKLKERITLEMDREVDDIIKALGFRASSHRR